MRGKKCSHLIKNKLKMWDFFPVNQTEKQGGHCQNTQTTFLTKWQDNDNLIQHVPVRSQPTACSRLTNCQDISASVNTGQHKEGVLFVHQRITDGFLYKEKN